MIGVCPPTTIIGETDFFENKEIQNGFIQMFVYYLQEKLVLVPQSV